MCTTLTMVSTIPIVTVLLLLSTPVQAQSNGKFCEGELGETGWDCEFVGSVQPDQVFEEFYPLPGSPDPVNPVVYKQIAGEPAFDADGTRTDAAAVFVLHDNFAYFCMLAESNGKAALFDAPEGGFVSSREEFPTGSWIPESVKALIADGTKLEYIVYTHPHLDHMGGAGFVADYFADDEPLAISSRRTRWTLKKRDGNDPTTIFGNNRGVPVPEYWQDEELHVGGLRFELAKAHAHTAGDYLIFLDKNLPENVALGIDSSLLLITDTVFPGWSTYFFWALSYDLSGYYEALNKILEYDFDVLVSGHIFRLGNKDDVQIKIDLFEDVSDGARMGLATVALSDIIDSTGIADPTNQNFGNTWLPVNEYQEHVVDICEAYVLDADARGRDWSTELAGIRANLRSQCWAMQMWIRIG